MLSIRSKSFLAIDFETANHDYHSACAIGLVKVVDNRIVCKTKYLIKPTEEYFHWRHIGIHGIRWEDVKDQPNFKKIWKEIKPEFEEVDFFVAHNATFDRNVLHHCCEYYSIKPPPKEFLCTVTLSKKLWNLRSARLDIVCKRFNIPLNHHELLSDALACASIMIRALKDKKFYYELA